MSFCWRFADGDDIDYHAFLAGINWLENPAPPTLPEDTLKVKYKNVSKVYNFENFLDETESERCVM